MDTKPKIQPTTTAYPSYPQPESVGPEQGWFERNRKNKPQSNSAGIASLIFISGGMNMASSIGFGSSFITPHGRMCWFIGAIIGAIFGAYLTNNIPKKLTVLTCAFLVALGGILFVSLPDNMDAVLAARYIDGIANGMVFAPTLVMVGEEGVKYMRGMLASSVETMCFSMGIFLKIIYDVTWTTYNIDGVSADQVQGMLSIVFGALGFLIAIFTVIESPVLYLVRGQEQEAIDALRRLQRPYVVTNETFAQLEEHKRYIAVNQEMTLAQSIRRGLPALLGLCLYRAMNALTFTLVTSSAFALFSLFAYKLAIWPFIIYGTLRWLGVMIAAFSLDCGGRKRPMLAGILVCAGMALGVGIILDDHTNFLSYSKMCTGVYLLFVYQFFAGLFITPSSAYLSEAFPLAIKPYFVIIPFIVEMIIQLGISSTFYSVTSISNYFYTVCALSIIFFIYGLMCLPETKKTTLREAQKSFETCRHMRMN